MFLGSIILLITTAFPIFILIFTCKHINSLSNQGKNVFDKLNIVSFCYLLSLIGMITCVIAYREYEKIAIATNNLCFWGAVIIYLVEFKNYIKEQRQLGSRFYNNGGKTIITFMIVLLCLMVTCLMDLLIPQLVNSAISNGSIEQNLKGLSYLLENPDIENTVKSIVGISVILLIALSFLTYKLYKSIKAEEIPDNSRITTVSVIGTVIILIDTFLITTYFNISGESEKVSFFAAINLLLGIGLIWYLYPKFKKALNECFGANIPESSPTQTVQSENKQVQVKSRTDMLLELKAVLDAGVLTQEEFDEQKKTILKTISENDKPTVDRLTDVKKLFEAGIYSQEEMETEKNKILGKSQPVSIQPATKPIEPSKPTTFCPVCGGVIEEGTTVCPYCKTDFSSYNKKDEPERSKEEKQANIKISGKGIVKALIGCLCIGAIGALAYLGLSTVAPKTIEDVDKKIADGEPEKAVEYLKEMAENGDTIACLRLVEYANNNKFGLKDEPSSITHWELIASEHGCKTVMPDLSIRYANGNGVEQDIQKAVSLLEKYAGYNSKKLLEKVNSLRDNNLAYAVHEKLSSENFRDAYLNMARDLYFGNGVEQNKEEAEQWLSKYVSEGNEDIETLENMFRFYEYVERKLFLYWAEKASNAGSFDAMFRLATYYENEGQYENAVKWYEKSADCGYIYAIGHLGLCYQYGKGVKADPVKAKKLLDQARESGVYWNNYTWEIKSRFKD